MLAAEPRSSPAPSRGRKFNRGTRQPARETRSTRLQVEIGTGSQGTASDEDADSGEESDVNEEGDEEEEGTDGGKDSEVEEEGESSDKGGPRSTRAQASRSKQKDTKKPSTSTATRRTGRRR